MLPKHARQALSGRIHDRLRIREGLRYAFADTEVELVEASDGETALAVVTAQQVDTVLLDIDMPMLDGLELLRRIKQKSPELPVLMHSCHHRLACVGRCIDFGAAGFIVKGPNKTVVIDAVRIAFAGGTIWTPDQLRYATNGGVAPGVAR